MVTLAQKIAKGTALVTLAKVLNFIFALISLMLVVRVLEKADYGMMVLVLSVFSLSEIFLDFGLKQLVIVEISLERKYERYDKVKWIIYRYSQLQIVLGGIIFLVILFAGMLVAQGIIGGLLQISACLIIAAAGRNIFSAVFNSHFDFRSSSLISIYQSFFRCLLIFIVGWWLGFGLNGIMWAYVISAFLPLFLVFNAYLRVIRKYVSVYPLADKKFVKTLLSRGKWTGGSYAVKRLTDNLAIWIPLIYLGPEAVAVLNISKRAYSCIAAVFSSLENVLMAALPAEISETEKLTKIANKVMKYSVWLSLPLMGISIGLAPFLFTFLFSAKYSQSAKIFQVLVILLVFYGLNLVMRPLFFAMRAQKYIFYIYSIRAIAFTLFAVLGINLWGLLGLPVAFILSGFLSFVLRYSYIRRKGIRIAFKEIFVLDEYDKTHIKELCKIINNILNSNCGKLVADKYEGRNRI